MITADQLVLHLIGDYLTQPVTRQRVYNGLDCKVTRPRLTEAR